MQGFFIFEIDLYFANQNILDALYWELEDSPVADSDVFIHYQFVVVFNVDLILGVVVLLQYNFYIGVIPYIVRISIPSVKYTFLYLPNGAQQHMHLLNFKNGGPLKLIEAHVLYNFKAEGILY